MKPPKHTTRPKVRDALNYTSTQKLEVLNTHTAADFDQVLLIASASRGGSSLLFDTLRYHEQLASPDGEHGKWYRLHDICYPKLTSDYVPKWYTQFNRQQLLRDMLVDVGMPDKNVDEAHWADNMIARLPLQFPDTQFDYQQIRQDLIMDSEQAYESAGVNTQLYDDFADTDLPKPISHVPIEEPPFVTSHDRKRALTLDDFDNTLLLKTSVDAYRLDWVNEQLFPDTPVKVIHLSRNPAASINGLYDGWRLNRGFQVYEMNLDISNHDSNYWNYDLPPGAPTSGQLLDICRFQWRSAHKHIFESSVNTLHIKFENFLDMREDVISAIKWYARLDDSELLHNKLHDLNTVMSTEEPRRARWKDRESQIRNAIDRGDIVFEQLLDELGYNREETWI